MTIAGLSYIGRVDDLVVFSTGVKVNALTLERALDAVDGIVRSAIVGSISSDRLIALVQPQLDNRSNEKPPRTCQQLKNGKFRRNLTKTSSLGE